MKYKHFVALTLTINAGYCSAQEAEYNAFPLGVSTNGIAGRLWFSTNVYSLKNPLDIIKFHRVNTGTNSLELFDTNFYGNNYVLIEDAKGNRLLPIDKNSRDFRLFIPSGARLSKNSPFVLEPGQVERTYSIKPSTHFALKSGETYSIRVVSEDYSFGRFNVKPWNGKCISNTILINVVE